MTATAEPLRLFDIIDRNVLARPTTVALLARADGKWHGITNAQIGSSAARISALLTEAGIKKGDRVAIVSGNRPEWIFADLGIMQLGAVTVPIYPGSSAADYAFILAHSGAKVALVATRESADRVRGMHGAQLPELQKIITFDRVAGFTHWSETTADAHVTQDGPSLAAAKMAVGNVDLASLIYTSGTSGTPKGVMLTHANLLAGVRAFTPVIGGQGIQRALSFLPLSHVFERVAHYLSHALELEISFAESFDTLKRDMAEVRPQFFAAVPRVLEKMYEGLERQCAELRGVKRWLAQWSVSQGFAYDTAHPLTAEKSLGLKIARKIVLNRWRDAMGGELRCVATGGAALQPRLSRIFWASGVKVLEGYGLTETTAVVACNTISALRAGSVGRVVPGAAIKIMPVPDFPTEEGEILVRGPAVFSGYFGAAEATKDAIDDQGWFHTGDIGRLDAAGFLTITDRLKEMFKTSGGKYIAPLAIESKLKESPYIANAIVVGAGQKFPAALLVLERAALSGMTEPAILELVGAEVERLTNSMGQWERIKSFRIVPEEWSIASGELTPKLSIKRRVLTDKYRDLIAAIYL